MAKNKRVTKSPGRPTRLTPESQASIVKDLATGTPRYTAALRVGITYATLKNWCRRGRAGDPPFAAFVAAIKKAEQDAVARHVGNIDACALGAVKTRVTVEKPDGIKEVTETLYAPEWTASAWFLERRYPADFGSNRHELAELRKQVAGLAALLQSVTRGTGIDLPDPPPHQPSETNSGSGPAAQ